MVPPSPVPSLPPLAPSIAPGITTGGDDLSSLDVTGDDWWVAVLTALLLLCCCCCCWFLFCLLPARRRRKKEKEEEEKGPTWSNVELGGCRTGSTVDVGSVILSRASSSPPPPSTSRSSLHLGRTSCTRASAYATAGDPGSLESVDVVLDLELDRRVLPTASEGGGGKRGSVARSPRGSGYSKADFRAAAKADEGETEPAFQDVSCNRRVLPTEPPLLGKQPSMTLRLPTLKKSNSSGSSAGSPTNAGRRRATPAVTTHSSMVSTQEERLIDGL